MDLSTITAADFKDLFYRDFPYLPEYDAGDLYNEGDRVYYSTTKLFYDCTVNGTTNIVPTDAANWDVVAAGVDDVLNYIADKDIERAQDEAEIVFNQALFSSDADIALAFNYLTAHYLVNDIRASNAGLASSASFPLLSRKVGNVSENYGVPSAYLTDPRFSFYTQSAYGMKYLSLVLPALVGNVGSVAGATQP